MMWKSNIICPECGAGYRRIVLSSSKGAKGEYRCMTCDHVLDVFDGSFEVLIRLTIPPQRALGESPRPLQKRYRQKS
jgi:predicted Zn finger-like uncharacterized protein